MGNIMDFRDDQSSQIMLIGAIIISLFVITLAIFFVTIPTYTSSTGYFTSANNVIEDTERNVGSIMDNVNNNDFDDAVQRLEASKQSEYAQQGAIYKVSVEQSSQGKRVRESAQDVQEGVVVNSDENELLRQLIFGVEEGSTDFELRSKNTFNSGQDVAYIIYDISVDRLSNSAKISVEQSGDGEQNSGGGNISFSLDSPISKTCTIPLPSTGDFQVDVTSSEVSQYSCEALEFIDYNHDDVSFQDSEVPEDFSSGFHRVEIEKATSGDISWEGVFQTTDDITTSNVSDENISPVVYNSTIEISYADESHNINRKIKVNPSEPNYDG